MFLVNDFAVGDIVTDNFARSFQTIFFEADTTLANFQFKKDDIAMGFSGLSAGSIDATVGIRNDTQFFTIDDVVGSERGLAPGGLISTNLHNSGFNNAHLLPWDSDKILLFRPQVDSKVVLQDIRLPLKPSQRYPNQTVAFSSAQ